MFLEIENEVYALDLDEIVDFIFKPHNNKNVESSQTLVYSTDENDNENKLKLVTKQLTENKNNDNANNDSYHFLATPFRISTDIADIIFKSIFHMKSPLDNYNDDVKSILAAFAPLMVTSLYSGSKV